MKADIPDFEILTLLKGSRQIDKLLKQVPAGDYLEIKKGRKSCRFVRELPEGVEVYVRYGEWWLVG